MLKGRGGRGSFLQLECLQHKSDHIVVVVAFFLVQVPVTMAVCGMAVEAMGKGMKQLTHCCAEDVGAERTDDKVGDELFHVLS